MFISFIISDMPYEYNNNNWMQCDWFVHNWIKWKLFSITIFKVYNSIRFKFLKLHWVDN